MTNSWAVSIAFTMPGDTPKNVELNFQKSTTDLIPNKEVVVTSQSTFGHDWGTKAEVAVYHKHRCGVKSGGFAGASYFNGSSSWTVGIRFIG